MEAKGLEAHWERVYQTKREDAVSWYEETPRLSLDLLRAAGASANSGVIDIGGGASKFADTLLAEGFHDITVLDISAAALETTRARLGANRDKIRWIVADVTAWQPDRQYDFWHDRAAFHFLVEPAAQEAYARVLRAALKPGGAAIIATFAPDGPEMCSGLPVCRHDAGSIRRVLGDGFTIADERRHTHLTPWGTPQRFQFSTFRRLP